MRSIGNLLIVLGDDRDQARYVLEKARVLAEGSGARTHAVRIVYEGIADLDASVIDATTDLKTYILEAEEITTQEILESTGHRIPGLESATLWNASPWEGILHAARQTEADLIIKGAELHHRFGEVVRTPDDWNLLRCSEVPVMLVKPRAWVPSPIIISALDAFDDDHEALNVALLQESAALANVLGGELHVVVAYPLFERWVGELGGLRDYDDLKEDVEAEIRDRLQTLARRCEVEYERLYAMEGQPAQVIVELAEELDAELVVVGTQGRRGLKGVLLGNTSERLVHHLATDVVTVHAPGTGVASQASS